MGYVVKKYYDGEINITIREIKYENFDLLLNDGDIVFGIQDNRLVKLKVIETEDDFYFLDTNENKVICNNYVYIIE